MKKVIIIILSLLITLIFIRCGTVEGYRKLCDSWIGKPEQALTNEWGYPQKTMIIANGNMVYIYEWNVQITIPSDTATDPSSDIDLDCTTYFEINQDSIIVNYSFEGSSCVAKEK